MPTARPEPARPGAAPLPASTRLAFVSNFVPHYRVGLFESLARLCQLSGIFYSDGGEWYWQRSHGVQQGNFKCRYLAGIRLFRGRITPALLPRLLLERPEVIIKCINGRFALPLTYLAARLTGAPFVLWTGIWCRLTTPRHRLLFPITRYLYRHADAVVTYGEHVRRYLLSEGVPAERVFLAPQAIDNAAYGRPIPVAERLALRAELQLAESDRVLLYIGRLEPGKGLEVLIEAIRRAAAPGPVLVLCGAGQLEESLREQVEQAGLTDRVRFAGYIATSATPAYYAIAWASVLVSTTMPTGREPWGLVVNEAFNQGVPVITSDAVGAAAGGLVRDRVNGLIVPERDPAALARAIDLLFGDPSLRERLSAAAREEILAWTHLGMAEGFRDAAAYALARRRASRETA